MYVDQVQKLYESTKKEQNKQQLKLFNNQVANYKNILYTYE